MEATAAMEAASAVEAASAAEATARAATGKAAAKTCPPAHGAGVLERAAVHMGESAFRPAGGTRVGSRPVRGWLLCRDLPARTGLPR
jgi:hypothetical protein